MTVWNNIGSVVESVSYKFKPASETNFADGVGGSWYVSPARHGLEFLTIAPCFLILTYYFGYKALIKNKSNNQLLVKNTSRPPRSFLETLLLIIMTASFLVTVIHKAITGTGIFLLQPCHASAVLLILIMAWPDDTVQFVPQLLFNIYLHTLWGSTLALAFPDLRDHDMFGEVFNFFLEHGLILVLPFYLMLTKRYVILPLSLDVACFSFCLYGAYHLPLLHAVSLRTGYNLNYTLVPPTLGFLMKAGHWYRLIMFGAALLLMYITRFIAVELFIKFYLTNIRYKETEKKKM